MGAIAYIQKIRSECKGFGICKVVPPASWKPEFGLSRCKHALSTRLQRIDRLGAHARAKGSQRPKCGAKAGAAASADAKTPAASSASEKLPSKPAEQERICWECGSASDPDKMVQCRSCTGYYHIFCQSPPLHKVPPADTPWTCGVCSEYKKQSFGFSSGKQYTLDQYEERCAKFKREWFGLRPDEPLDAVDRAKIERQFWSIVRQGKPAVEVEYGSELDTTVIGSGFPSKGKFANHPWNLNNLPKSQGSLLRHLDDIAGITIPWLYIGMQFSSFCWHNEDHYCSSISYNHRGAPKQWYGIPGDCAAAFEAMMRETYPVLFKEQPDLLYQLVTLVSPSTLKKKGVSVCRATHYPGEFIVTWPQAYHAGFNYGFNVAEAVNFACPDWFSWGTRAVEHYRSLARVPVFSHDELLVRVALNQPDAETASWLTAGLRRLRDNEYMARLGLAKQGLATAARWVDKKVPAGRKKRKKPRARKYRNVIHKGDRKSAGSADDGRKKGLLPRVAAPSAELGGFKAICCGGQAGEESSSDADSRCYTALTHLFGRPNGNSQDHCAVCRYPVFVSCVRCPCTPNLACLAHAKELCSCDLSQKHISYRLSLWELDVTLGAVDAARAQADETARSILLENESVFAHRRADQKMIHQKEASTLLPRAREWTASARAFLDGGGAETDGSNARETLEALLNGGRAFIWGSRRLHPARALYSRLLRTQGLVDTLEKLAREVPADRTLAAHARSLDADRRPHLAQAEAAIVDAEKTLPPSLSAPDLSELRKLVSAARALVQEFCDAMAPGARPLLDECTELLRRARLSPFVIPEQYKLKKRLEPVHEWMRSFNGVLKDATMHADLKPDPELVPDDSPYAVTLRNARGRRRKIASSLKDFLDAPSSETSAASRPERLRPHDTMRVVRTAARLPVDLRHPIGFLKLLLKQAQRFESAARDAFMRREAAERKQKHINVQLGVGAYARTCGEQGLKQLLALRGWNDGTSNMNATSTSTDTDSLLSLYAQGTAVALRTRALDRIAERLRLAADWDLRARRLVADASIANECAAAWKPALSLLAEAQKLHLDRPDLAVALQHALSFQAWAARVDAIMAPPCAAAELRAAAEVYRELRQMETVIVWPRRTVAQAPPDEDDAMAWLAVAPGDRCAQLRETLAEAEELQRLCRAMTEMKPKLEANLEAEVATEGTVAAVASLPTLKPSVADLEALVRRVRASGLVGVGEAALFSLAETVAAWRYEALAALPASTRSSAALAPCEAQPPQRPKKSAPPRKVWSATALRAMIKRAMSLSVDLSSECKALTAHLAKVRAVTAEAGTYLMSLGPSIARRILAIRIIQSPSIATMEDTKTLASASTACSELRDSPEMLPRARAWVGRFAALRADTPERRRLKRLVWAANVLIALSRRTLSFGKLSALVKRNRAESFVDTAPDGEVDSEAPASAPASPEEIACIAYALSEARSAWEAGVKWKEQFEAEARAIKTVTKLLKLRDDAAKFPFTVQRVARIDDIVVRARQWLSEARKVFPDIVGDETLGLPLLPPKKEPMEEPKVELLPPSITMSTTAAAPGAAPFAAPVAAAVAAPSAASASAISGAPASTVSDTSAAVPMDVVDTDTNANESEPADAKAAMTATTAKTTEAAKVPPRDDLSVAKVLVAAGSKLQLAAPAFVRLERVVRAAQHALVSLNSLLSPRPRGMPLERALVQVLCRAPLEASEREAAARALNGCDEARDASGNEVYCLCRRASEKGVGKGAASGGMVCCDDCDVWFHSTCVNIPTKALATLLGEDSKFLCPLCSAKKAVPYAFSPPPRTMVAKPALPDLEAALGQYQSGSIAIPTCDGAAVLLAAARRCEARLRRAEREATAALDAAPSPIKQRPDQTWLYSAPPAPALEALRAALDAATRTGVKCPSERAAGRAMWRIRTREALGSVSQFEDLETLLKEYKANFQTAASVHVDAPAVPKPVAVKEEEQASGTLPKSMAQDTKDVAPTPQSSSRTGRKRKAVLRAAAPARKRPASVASTLKPLDDLDELQRLHDLVLRARKLRTQARLWLKKRAKPQSEPAERFLAAARALSCVEVDEAVLLRQRVEVFCVCKTVYDASRPMVGCDRCDGWFHPKCLGWAPGELESKQNESFVCAECSVKA